MAKVGAKRAAELTGKSKSTIQRAMKTGKISYDVDDAGRRMIDVSELDRAYGLQTDTDGNTVKAKTSNATTTKQQDNANGMSIADAELLKAKHTLELERLNMQNRMLNEQLNQHADIIADLKAQRDQWQKQAQQVLLTSQNSQKQSDERIAELRESEEARLRRAVQHKQQLQQKTRIQQQSMDKPVFRADNENATEVSAASEKKERAGLFGGLFNKKKKSA